MKRIVLLIAAVLAFFIAVGGAQAFSFPGPVYPGNQYGLEARYYNGPWGEVMVHGGYGYFQNFNGYRPYGYKTYGSMYTPWDIRNGGYRGYGYTGSAYGGYGGYQYGYGGRYVYG
jgi:hypothetical protein